MPKTQRATALRIRKHAVLLVIPLALAAMASCSSRVPGANGKYGVLNFSSIPFPMSRHLENEIFILGEAKGYDWQFKEQTYTYDFSGTTLEVSGEGIEPIDSSLDPSGYYRVRFRCQAPSGQVTEFGVKILDGTSVRYADAVDVRCYEPQALNVRLVPESVPTPTTPLKMVLGGEMGVSAWVTGPVDVWDLDRATLIGSGTTLADGGPLSVVSRYFDVYTNDLLVVRADRLGSDPVVFDGPFQAVLPVEVIPDDAWNLKVWIDPFESNPGAFEFGAYPELLDGGIGVGLREACNFDFASDGGVSLYPHQCRGYAVPGAVTDGGEVCVTALGRTACATP